MRLLPPRQRPARAPISPHPGFFKGGAGPRLPWAVGGAVFLMGTRAWAQGSENVIGFLLDLAVGFAAFVVLSIVGAVTMARNIEKERRPVSIFLGIVVGLVKLGWALLLVGGVYDRNVANPRPGHSGAVPWDYMMGALALFLLAMGAFESFLALKALVAPTVPPDSGAEGQHQP